MTGERSLVLATALAGGGAEEVAKLMADNLRSSTCVLFENEANIILPEHEMHIVGGPRATSSLGVLLINVWRLIFIQFIKFKLRPTSTISHLEGPNFANILTFMGGKRILFVHNRVSMNYSSRGIRNLLKKRLVEMLYHRADRIVGVSRDVCSELVESFKVEPERVLVIPNPIDIAAITAGSVRAYGDVRDQILSERYLINVASLSPQKNHQLLLRIFAQLVKKHEGYCDLKLVLVGDGNQRQNLRKLSIELDLEICELESESFSKSAQVFFVGFERNPYPLVRHAKLLIMTSLWEGLPIALLEAMSLGIPSVLSDCSDGIRTAWEILPERPDPMLSDGYRWSRYGALIREAGDDVASIRLWSTAIVQLLKDQELYENCSVAAKVRAEYFDIANVSTIWKRELLEQAR